MRDDRTTAALEPEVGLDIDVWDLALVWRVGDYAESVDFETHAEVLRELTFMLHFEWFHNPMVRPPYVSKLPCQVGRSTPEPIARAIDKTVFPEGLAWRNCLVALTQRVQAATDYALYIDFWDARTACCRVPFTGNETYDEARGKIDKAVTDFLAWRG